jgi:hypothetical protein
VEMEALAAKNRMMIAGSIVLRVAQVKAVPDHSKALYQRSAFNDC